MLTKNEFEMLSYLAENETVHPDFLHKRFGKPADTLLRHLERLHAATLATRLDEKTGNRLFTKEYTVTGEGILLLNEYRTARREKWIDRAFSFANGFCSGVATSVVSYFLIQWIAR